MYIKIGNAEILYFLLWARKSYFIFFLFITLTVCYFGCLLWNKSRQQVVPYFRKLAVRRIFLFLFLFLFSNLLNFCFYRIPTPVVRIHHLIPSQPYPKNHANRYYWIFEVICFKLFLLCSLCLKNCLEVALYCFCVSIIISA